MYCTACIQQTIMHLQSCRSVVYYCIYSSYKYSVLCIYYIYSMYPTDYNNASPYKNSLVGITLHTYDFFPHISPRENITSV